MLQESVEREARPRWTEVPQNLVLKIQEVLQEKITGGEIAWGGYSPSAAFIVTCASKKKFFIKGSHPGEDAHGTQMLRQEIGAYQTLPVIRDISPAYLGCVSDGGEDGWMLAVFEYIDTAPTLLWTVEKISKVFELLGRIHSNAEKSAALPDAREKNFVEKYLRPEGGWLRFRDEPKIRDKFLTLFENETAAGSWLLSALPKLCGRQEKVSVLHSPAGIIHQDLRSDNILFDTAGRAYLIDWPNVCYGPVVLDIAGFISAISAESDFDADTLLALYEKTTGQKIDRESLAIALASLSGHLADNAYRAVPPKLPRLRRMQKKTLWAMLEWSQDLIGTERPPCFKV